MNKFIFILDYAILIVWSVLVFAFWNYLRPFEIWEPLIVANVFFIAVLIQMPKRHHHALSLDKLTFFSQSAEDLTHEVEQLQHFWRGVFMARASSLFIPAVLASSFFYLEPIHKENFLARIKSIFQQFSGTAELFVISTDHQEIKYELNRKKTIPIHVVGQNLVRINVSTFTQIAAPAIVLKPLDGHKTSTSFIMSSVQKEGVSEQDTRYEAIFSVSEASELWIPSISQKIPLANLVVDGAAEIQVNLSTEIDSQIAQLDTTLIPLQVIVKSDFPLDLIELKIQVGEQIFKQKIMDILDPSKRDVTTRYMFLPEPYMTEDQGEIIIRAQAWDKTQPVPRSGISTPMTFKIQSAYGRYLAVLSALSDVSRQMSEAIEDSRKVSELSGKIEEKLSEAIMLAGDSVFFDALDRLELERMLQRWTEQKVPTAQTIYEVKDDLSRFLAEHEALNDQERDLDFFVAAKQISRTLVDAKWKSTRKNLTRLKNFVEERGKRWLLRVERLPRNDLLKPGIVPGKIQEVIKNLNSTGELADADQFEQAKEKLNAAVDSYRTWIDQLVKAEEEFKKKTEKEKNQALAQGRDEIRVLRKNQAEISTRLDHKDPSEKKLTAQAWPQIKFLENKNKDRSQALAKKMESFSSLASRRLIGASEQMTATIQAGDEKKELAAESASDAAARLLIIADQAAAEEQGRAKRDRGRRKRLTGNNYFGQAVSGGDVDFTRNYQVDRKYREDIIERIDPSTLDENDKKILDDYVRDVVR